MVKVMAKCHHDTSSPSLRNLRVESLNRRFSGYEIPWKKLGWKELTVLTLDVMYASASCVNKMLMGRKGTKEPKDGSCNNGISNLSSK